MLTGYQCQVVAFYPQDAGEFICRDCAVAQVGELSVDAAENGLTELGAGLSPVIRYTLEEHASESLWEYLAQEYEGEELERRFDEADLQEQCGSCGGDLL